MIEEEKESIWHMCHPLVISRIVSKHDMRMKNKVKLTLLKVLAIKFKKISTHLLARLGWFCPVVSEPVKPYFTRFLRVLTFCLRASKIVILKENGVVNGVVKGGK